MRRPLARHLFSTPAARLLAVFVLIYTTYYLFWRASATLNPAALWFAVPLLVVEVHGAINFALFTLMTWDVTPVAHPPAQPGHSVDIFIPTYNEDLSILKMTILGALKVRYPHETWVLDDGRRPALRKLCDELGVHYLTRHDNTHHKAGNINAALAQTSGEFIAIFDADHVPLPDFLEHTVGYFEQPAVAFVQTTQEYYNLDSMQHRTDWQQGETWHEQTLFSRVIQPGKNRWNSAFWCGSNSVMRRAALLDIGGIATGSVTEDIHTSLRIHAAGWTSVYHDEVLSMGLAAQDYHAFTVQRLRWGQGAMQVLRRENPLFKRGLSVVQRINYIASMVTYLEAYQRLVYTLAPAVVLLTAVLPIRVGVVPFLSRFAPYLILGLIANTALGRGYFRPLETERYNLLKMVTFLKATLALVGVEPSSFKVTPKSASSRAVVRRLVWPYYVLGAMLALGMGIGVLRLAGLFGGPGANVSALVVSEGWAAFNLWIIGRGIHTAAHRITRRAVYRFPVCVPLTLRQHGHNLTGITANLHEKGLSVLLGERLDVGSSPRVMLHLPHGTVVGTMQVRSSRPNKEQEEAGLWRSGGLFTPDSPDDAAAVREFLIGVMARQLDAARDEGELATAAA